MHISQKIALAMTVWVSLVLLMVGNQNFQLFSILVLIGLLISRELSSVYIKPSLADKLDVFIQIGIVVFIAIVAQKILSILGIL